MEAEYVATCKAAKEPIWLKKFLVDLGIMRIEQSTITLFWDNSGAVAQSKEPINHRRGKDIKHKYHLIREIVSRGDVAVAKIPSAENLVDLFIKTLS
jgi:hypothetical protein